MADQTPSELEIEFLTRALEIAEKKYPRKQSHQTRCQNISSTFSARTRDVSHSSSKKRPCKGCGDLDPVNFSDPYEGKIEYLYTFNLIRDSASSGCASCTVILTAITKLSEPPSPDIPSVRLRTSHPSVPRSSLRIEFMPANRSWRTVDPLCIEVFALPGEPDDYPFPCDAHSWCFLSSS